MFAVVVYHAGFVIPGGYIGVDVFFVISGYVIADSLRREWLDHGVVDFRRFYLRRARRLLPAAALMTATVVVLGILLSPVGSQGVLARTGIWSSLFNANHYLAVQPNDYFASDLERNALLHTWSLSVEEQFYVVFPLLIVVAWRFGHGRVIGSDRSAVIALSGVAVISFAFSLWLTSSSGWSPSWAFYLAPARAWEFLAGALLVFARPAIRSLPRWLATPFALTGAVSIAAAMRLFDSTTVFPGTAALVPVLGTVLLIAAGDINAGALFGRLLACRPAQVVGDLSYGWYLWHWPAIVFARALVPDARFVALAAAFASLGVAAISYRLLETPIRTAPKPTPRSTVRLALACVAVGLVGSAALIPVAERIQDREAVAEIGPHYGRPEGCGYATPLDELPAECTVGPADAELEIVVVGDSMAGQLSGAVLGATTGTDTKVTLAWAGGCAFAIHDVDWPALTDAQRGCFTFVADLHDDLLERRPDVVVMSSASHQRTEGLVPLPPTRSDAPVATIADRVAVWDAALEATIVPLQNAGIEVVLVHPSPWFEDWTPEACAVVVLELSPERCSIDGTEGVEAMLAPALEVERRVAARLGVEVIDPNDLICTDRCRSYDGGWIMRDGGHISRATSAALIPRLAAALPLADRSALRVVDS